MKQALEGSDPVRQLPEADFERVQPLFTPLKEHRAPQAVIAGATPGAIYVDDPVAPRAALLHVQNRFYLAGDPRSDAFNMGLRHLFAEEIFPAAREAGKEAFVLYYPPGWEEAIEGVILRGKHPLRDLRHTYVFEGKEPPDWRSLMKRGFEIVPVSAELLAGEDLDNVAELREELASEAPSVRFFLMNRLGLCLVRDDEEIVGWALSEYDLDERTEVGIATVEGCRRRGVATITGGALIEEALALGFTRIGWHCWANNAGSVATALRLGFEKVGEEFVYITWFDEDTALAEAVGLPGGSE